MVLLTCSGPVFGKNVRSSIDTVQAYGVIVLVRASIVGLYGAVHAVIRVRGKQKGMCSFMKAIY